MGGYHFLNCPNLYITTQHITTQHNAASCACGASQHNTIQYSTISRSPRIRGSCSLLARCSITRVIYRHNALSHPVRSRESEVKYLSNLVEALIPILLPRASKDSQCVNALLREILGQFWLQSQYFNMTSKWHAFKIFMIKRFDLFSPHYSVMKCILPGLDALADPDILNYIGKPAFVFGFSVFRTNL